MAQSAAGSRWWVRHLAGLTLCAGLFLVLVPLLKPPLLLQFNCYLAIHPGALWLIDKFFELIDKIGDASIIAGLIGIVVDQGLKSKLIQEVVEAASPKLIGRHLPDPVRDALLGYFDIRFVRPTWSIQYELSTIIDCPGFLEVTSRIEGPIVNYGPSTEEFGFFTSIDPSPVHPQLGKSRIVRASVIPEAGTDGFDENPPADKLLMQPDGTTDGSKFFERAISLVPGVRYKTVVEVVEYRPTTYFMPLFTGTTVVRTVLSIRYPKELLDIQVSTGVDQSIKPEHTQWGHEWVISTTLLPGQCIMTTWTPKPSQQPKSSNAAQGAPAAGTSSVPTLPQALKADPIRKIDDAPLHKSSR